MKIRLSNRLPEALRVILGGNQVDGLPPAPSFAKFLYKYFPNSTDQKLKLSEDFIFVYIRVLRAWEASDV